MPVTLQNISRTMQTYNLAHEKFQNSDGKHSYKEIHVTVVDSDSRSGAMSARKVAKQVPESIRLLAGEVCGDFDDEILNVDEIKAAIARNELRIVAQTPIAPVAAPDDALPLALKRTAPEEAPILPPPPGTSFDTSKASLPKGK